jgi:peptidoglycan/xylan/chitin deacetylase (PgdA/CDA1 family)
MSDTLVLAYHAVSADWPSDLAVPPDALERQLSYLVRRGYRGVTFREAARGEARGRRLAVTFDDAYRSILEKALPVLSELGIPGTVFVPTAFAGSQEPMRWPEIEHWAEGAYARELYCMSWGQLAELVAAGWEVGSHTRTHPHLPLLDDRELELELAESKAECERQLGGCATLAYPFGDHDDRVIEAVGRAGYEAACTLPSRLHAASPLRWPRVGIYPVDSTWRFRAKVLRGPRALRASPAWGMAGAAAARLRRGRGDSAPG